MKKILILAFAFSVLLAISACDQPQAPAAAATEGGRPDRSDQLYIQIGALTALDYFYDHMMGLRLVGESLGVQTDFVGPTDYDLTAMVAAFDASIARRPNGILVFGFDEVLTPSIRRAIAEGIPVVTVGADLPDSGRLAFIGTGHRSVGRLGGEYLVNLLGDTFTVGVLTFPGQFHTDERVAGYMEIFDRHPGIEVVQIVDTQSDPVVAAAGATALLQAFPNLDAIICVEAAGGTGAATAVREAGLAGQVTVIAMDRGNEVIHEILEGVITASVAQQSAIMPYYAVQLLYNLNNSHVGITSDNAAAGVLGVPTMIDTGPVIINYANARYFLRD